MLCSQDVRRSELVAASYSMVLGNGDASECGRQRAFAIAVFIPKPFGPLEGSVAYA